MNAEGVYGARGVASNTNAPGARYSLVGWVDLTGNLWLFGGRASTSNSSEHVQRFVEVHPAVAGRTGDRDSGA